MAAQDLYEVLGIPETAEASEIKRAYRRRALKTHPDVNASPNARDEFAEVLNAYEVLSDDKKRRGYDTKRKFSSPFRGSSSSSSGSGSGSGSNSGGSGGWGRATYDAAKEEASRRWKEQNPTPDEIGDSFGDIFKDILGGIASAGSGSGGVLNDVVDFLENRVDGFSSETSVEFEDLMSSTDLDEMQAELANTRLLLQQLEIRSRKLSVERIASEKEVVASKAGNRPVTDIDELNRQMAVVERAAGVKARYDEMQGHVKRAKARLGRLEKKVGGSQQKGGGGGTRGAEGNGSFSGDRSRSQSQYSSSGSNGSRGGSSSTSTSTSTSSSNRGGGASGRETPRTGGGGGSGGGGGGGGPARTTSRTTRPPPPRPRGGVPGGRRRLDDPDVEAELAKMKREMGL